MTKPAEGFRAPASRRKSIRWVAGATLTMAGALGIGRFAYTPLLPDMMSVFGWSFAQGGDVASANFLGYMVGAMLAPAGVNSPHTRVWLAFSFMASVATTYLGAEVVSYLDWLVLRFCSGVASAFCLVMVTTHLMHTLAREDSLRYGNVQFAGVGIGIVVCMMVLFVSQGVDEQWARLGAVAALLMAGAWLLIASDDIEPVPEASTVDSGGGSSSGYLWRIIVGYGFFGFGYVVSATFVAAMAASLTNPVDADVVWLMVGIALVPSVYLWQWIANRLGTVVTLQVAYVVEAVGVLIVASGDNLAALVAGGVLLGGTFAAITALGLSAAREHSLARVGFAVSAMTTAFALGQLIGPALAGRMADAQGHFVWPSLIAAGLLCAGALMLVRKATD